MTEDPQFVHSGAPGRRAPITTCTATAPRSSTLDLFDTSLRARRREGEGWVTAARARGDRCAGSRCGPTRVGTTPTLHDPTGTWASRPAWALGSEPVRPDGHVAWRTGESAVDSAQTLIGGCWTPCCPSAALTSPDTR